MDRDKIQTALSLIYKDSTIHWGPDLSSYEKFVEFWPKENGAIPTEAEIENAWKSQKPKDDAINEIYNLESTITPRRIREMTTADGAKWVDDVEKLIAIERAKL
ncbi:uncharacterized protein METZ01_LOCUS12342 [marine metagenome]|uniref:Uncharacterized protein n=1 Tax=marine metagenome TaxID=408172 RepID=A0A381P016_9ZZZZ